MFHREETAMLKILSSAAALLIASAAPAAAQAPCPMNYKFFEFAIPHLDLAECPKDLAKAGAFCRVTTANDNVHVFVFEEKGQQCLLAAKSFSGYTISVK